MAIKQYRCIRKCYFGKGETERGKAPPRRVYQVGDVETFDPDVDRIPRHFVPGDEFTTVRPSAPFQAVVRGLRAPVDPDQLEAVAKRAAQRSSPVDAHKAVGEEFEAPEKSGKGKSGKTEPKKTEPFGHF